MSDKQACEILIRLKLEAIATLHSAAKTRRSRDISFHEDVELTREEHQKIDEVLKHLLAGHEGNPCPAGDRPIIGIARQPNSRLVVPAETPNAFRPLRLLQRHR